MKLIKDIFAHYMRVDTFEKGAALSYYVAFSFLPMIMIVISVLGIIFKEDTVSADLYEQLKMYAGDQNALQFEKLIQNQHLNHDSILTTILGFAALALASTAAFNQLHKSLNAIWRVKAKPKSGVLHYIIRHLTFLIMLIILGFILIMSASVSRLLLKYAANLPDFLANARLYKNLVSVMLVILTFIILFKFLGDAHVPWKTALIAAAVTSILFIIGKEAISLYIAHSNLTTTFGAASIIALLMIWVFYTAQLLYLGACFAFVVGKKYGGEIRPGKNAVRIVEKEVSSKPTKDVV